LNPTSTKKRDDETGNNSRYYSFFWRNTRGYRKGKATIPTTMPAKMSLWIWLRSMPFFIRLNSLGLKNEFIVIVKVNFFQS